MRVLARHVTPILKLPPTPKRTLQLVNGPTHDYLKDARYKVSVPYAYLMSEQEMVVVGVPTGIDHDKKQPFNHNITIACVNIYKLASMYAHGAPATLVDIQDTVEIAQIIDAHLANWKTYMENNGGYFGAAPDIDTLLNLENYLFHIYPFAVTIHGRTKLTAPVRRITTERGDPRPVSVDPPPLPKSKVEDIIQAERTNNKYFNSKERPINPHDYFI